MDIRKYTSSVSAILMALVVCSSCERELADLLGRGKSDPNAIKVNVSSSVDYRETKSVDAGAVLTRTFGDDDFSISEYVCDIEDVMEVAGTKGTIITTTGINTNGKSFTVDGWGMISPERGKPQVLTNHLPKLTASYTSSGTDHWPWAGGANPKWVNEANLHIWSYYPVGKIDPTITIDDAVDANNTAVFTNYTTDNTDLLIAYNKEYREFQKDAAGNHTYNADGEINDPIVGSPSFNVHFYHALAAIEFELETSTSGADVHSITLCKVNAENNIVTTDGIAMTGDCTVTGPNISTDGISWGTLSNKKPFHHEFSTGLSITGDYKEASGSGVFFMIPQDVEDIVVIVEFSKPNSEKFYTKVGKLVSTNEKSMDVSWKAGKYYRYQLTIGEFHMPGELIHTGGSIAFTSGFHGGGQDYLFNSELHVKGVKKLGVVMDGMWVKNTSGALPGYLVARVNNDTYTYSQVSNWTTSDFNFDFQPFNPPKGTINWNGVSTTYTVASNMLSWYSFGDNPPVTETYNNRYTFNLPATGGPGSNVTNEQFFVFDLDTIPDRTTNKTESFNVVFIINAGSSSSRLVLCIRCVIILEVELDSSLPSDFNTIDWSAI